MVRYNAPRLVRTINQSGTRTIMLVIKIIKKDLKKLAEEVQNNLKRIKDSGLRERSTVEPSALETVAKKEDDAANVNKEVYSKLYCNDVYSKIWWQFFFLNLLQPPQLAFGKQMEAKQIADCGPHETGFN